MFFFFNDTATTEIYTLSLHDALPIWVPGVADSRQPVPDQGRHRTMLRQASGGGGPSDGEGRRAGDHTAPHATLPGRDRKSTRLNSSHGYISYAVFCLKKKTRRRSALWHVGRTSRTLKDPIRGF